MFPAQTLGMLEGLGQWFRFLTLRSNAQRALSVTFMRPCRPETQVHVVGPKDHRRPNKHPRIEGLHIECGANECDDGQADKVDRHNDARRGKGQGCRQTKMRDQACKADQNNPRQRVSWWQSDVHIISGPNQSKDRLHSGEPEHDTGDRLCAGQFAGENRRKGKANSRASGGEGAQGDLSLKRAGDDQHTNRAKHRRQGANACDLFAKHKRGQKYHPDRPRKLKCKELGQRDDRQRKEPKVLTREMRQIAQTMQAELLSIDLVERATNLGRDQNDDEACDTAKQHDFKRVEFQTDRTARDGHWCEG